MKSLRPLLAVLSSLLVLPVQAYADLVVVVNPDNKTEQLTKTQIINIFLGNNREYPGGLPAKPIDLPGSSSEKALFYRGLVNKDLDQMAAYWSRLVFAGNTSPPTSVANGQDVMQIVASNKNAIGYVDRKYVDTTRVKIVFSLP